MILIACLDDKNGMMFNKRRQSMDSAVRADIAVHVSGGAVWMNGYSAKQFTDTPELKINVDEDFLRKAGDGEFCFLEGDGAHGVENRIEKLVLYKWNRIYPADVRFDLPMEGWKLDSTADFAGSSHEKITKEVYIK